jgi:hypothetical protein
MATPVQTRPSNRRGTQRRKPRTSIKVECRKGSTGLGPNIAGPILDLSDSGIRLIVTQALALKAEVEIVISGYGMRDTIRRLGYVRWQVTLENGQFCMGVEFQKRLAYRDCAMLASPN